MVLFGLICRFDTRLQKGYGLQRSLQLDKLLAFVPVMKQLRLLSENLYTTMTICPKALAKVSSNICQILIKLLTNSHRLLIFCQRLLKCCQIWSHCRWFAKQFFFKEVSVSTLIIISVHLSHVIHVSISQSEKWLQH